MALALLAAACQPVESDDGLVTPRLSQQPEFRKYWYAGQAELNRYRLEQARYGELHRGEAVLIFVTEPFLKDKQVKYEGPADQAPGEVRDVFKLNATSKFLPASIPIRP